MTLELKDNDDENEALMIHELAHQIRVSFDRRVKHLGLTRSQWRVLGIIRRNPGIRQARMAYLMEIEPITLVRLLDRMQKSGWIQRRPDPVDRRANSVVLTDKAKDILSKMMPLALDVRRQALAGFTAAEYSDMLAYLRRMKNNVAAMLCNEGNEECAAE